jgi:hypothetical protein
MPPIDRDLWQVMQQAMGNVSMPLTAHQQVQQVQQVMQNVEKEAMQQKVAKDAASKP